MWRFIDWFIPSVKQLSDNERLHSRAFVILSGGGGVLVFCNIAIILLVGLPVGSGILYLAAFASLAFVFPFLLRARLPLPLLRAVSLTYLATAFFLAAFLLGGFYSPVLPWIVSVPILTYYYMTGWRRWIGVLYAVAGTTVLWLLHASGYQFPYRIPPNLVPPVFSFTFVMSILYVLYITHVFVNQTQFGKRRLRQAKIDAEKGSEAKSRFLAIISHELRTPLNAIIGFSDLMKSETFGPLGHQNYRIYAEDIGISGRNLMGIVENILELTRIETNEVTLHETQFDAYDCVKNVVANLKAKKAIAPSVPIRIERAPLLPALLADKALISRGLAQLISNAVKFSADDGTVIVKLNRDAEGQFLMCVEDNGIGIESGDIAQLSQPFYQADNTLARKHEGLGLGVTLTKSIIAMHGGELRIASQPGRGTQMTLCLPAWRVSDVDGRPDTANGVMAHAGDGEPAVALPEAQVFEERAP